MYKQYTLILVTITSLSSMAQNIGIGVNAPAYPLTVGAVNSKGIAQKNGAVEIGFYTSSNGAYLQTWSNHSLNFATNNSTAQMTLSTEGNLGIGVSAPTARLDVNGTVRIRGGNPAPGYVLTSTDANGIAEWKPSAASAIKTIFISHPAFLPDRSVRAWTTLYPGVSRRPDNTGSGTYTMMAPISLPVGARIKEITWYFSDWNDTKNMTLSLVRDAGGTATNVSQVTSTGSAQVVGGRTLTVNLNYQISEQFHWLEVSVIDWPLDYTLSIHGAKIVYEM